MNAFTNSKFPALLLIICLCAFIKADAQKYRYSVPGLDTLQQDFLIGATSTSLLRSGQFEVILNNQLTSFQIALHQNGDDSPVFDRFRRTQFNTDLLGYYGVSAAGKFDVGVNLRYSRARTDNTATNSMFDVFESTTGAGTNDPFIDPTGIFDKTFGGLTYVGLRFRVMPFAKKPELLINGGYLFSTVKDETEQQQLAADRDIADIGITYYKRITTNIYYYLGGNFQTFFPSAVRDEYLFNTNASFFIIHRTTNTRFTFYPGLSYSLNFKPSQFDKNALIKTSDFLFALAGIQYAPSPLFSVFLSGGIPFVVDAAHPQQEIVRESYSSIALGFRSVF